LLHHAYDLTCKIIAAFAQNHYEMFDGQISTAQWKLNSTVQAFVKSTFCLHCCWLETLSRLKLRVYKSQWNVCPVPGSAAFGICTVNKGSPPYHTAPHTAVHGGLMHSLPS